MILKDYKIAIDGRPLTSGAHNGYSIYTRRVAVLCAKQGAKVTLVTDAPVPSADPLASLCQVIVLPKKRNLLWEQRSLLVLLHRSNFDAYFAGSNRGLPLLYFGKTRLILGLLDVIPFKFPALYLTGRKHAAIYRSTIRSNVRKANAIMTISSASKKDIEVLFPGNHVYANPIQLEYVPSVPHQTKKQFVYVGGVDPRKKTDVLLQAFASFHKEHPDYKLVLIGNNYGALDGLIKQLGLTQDVVITGYLTEQQKMAEIASSMAMVYLSLYEGYGLAIAEGLSAGVPVIAGDGGSQAEVGGTAVEYVNPEDAKEVAKKMTEVLVPATQKRLRQAAAAQAKLLAAQHIESDTAQTIADIIGAKHA